MSKNVIFTILLMALLCISKAQILFIGPYYSIGDIKRQGDLQKTIINDPNIKKIYFDSNKTRFQYQDTISMTYYNVYDSVPYIADSIIMLKNLRYVSITGFSKMKYVSPNLALLPNLIQISISNLGKTDTISCNLPKMKRVKSLDISASDSISVRQIIEMCPNIKKIWIYFEVQCNPQSYWNARNILYQVPKLKTLVVPYFNGLEYNSRQQIYAADENDTLYERVYYLDFDLSHCRHLRKIITDYELSDEMRRYCRKHFIRVVKFSRKRFWKKE